MIDRIRFRAAAPLALVVLAAAIGSAPRAAAIAADSRIVEVTLYADRAEVVREARVSLPAGSSAVEFTGIPFHVDHDSFRASATGPETTLGAVEVREQAGEPEESPEVIGARREVQRIEEQIALLDEQVRVANDLRAFLNAIRATAAENESKNLSEGRADPASIAAVYTLLQTRLTELARQGIEAQRERSRLVDELAIAQARLAALRPAGAIRSRTVAVELTARQAGERTLRLAYVVQGASWRPSYRASVDAASGAVSLASEGVVRQVTGEDWTDVVLRLSTAAPGRGVEPPQLAPLLLRPLSPGMAGREDDARDQVVASGAAANYQAPRMELETVPTAPPPPVPAAPEEAAIVQSAYNVNFEVPGRSDVPADGREHRVVLRQEELAGKIVYRAVPTLDPAAFLTVRTSAPPDYPLLAGPVRVFASGAFLGTSWLPETGPRAELTLPFGVDNRIKIERLPQPQEQRREGARGRERQIAYAFKTTIENLRDQPVDLILEDRIPVAEDERIKVEVGNGTTAGYDESERRPGVLLWTLALAPREKREVRLEYTVSFPRDLMIPGVE